VLRTADVGGHDMTSSQGLLEGKVAAVTADVHRYDY
jgi:hypothetical protein